MRGWRMTAQKYARGPGYDLQAGTDADSGALRASL